MGLTYVTVTHLGHGYLVDPAPYLAELDTLAERLPPGAARFARADGHYDMTSEHSVKDLKIARFEVVDSFAALTVTMELAYNDLPGVPRLTLSYADVRHLAVTVRSTYEMPADWITAETRKLGDVLADELLPHEHGCAHVIETLHGGMTVVAADVTAQWSDGHA